MVGYMEVKRIRYPIGVQTFRDIVEGGYLYIDKTGIVHDLAETYKYVFLSRPRRFGKSLLSSTFHSYFAGEKELFEGLEAGRHKKEWTRHPVFHFDMSTAKHLNEEQLQRTLSYKLSEYENELSADYGIAEDDINARFERLVKAAVRKTSEKAVIIIDEYDAPLLDVMNDKERLTPMRQIMRNFYSPIKSLDPYLRFVFITGINKFAQLSIFSELNNLQNISMMPRYSAICGITQSELERDMKESVRNLAYSKGISYDNALQQLKNNYDGYHFCHGAEDIYTPFSLIKCLDAQEFGSYWFETGTPTFLLERLQKNPMDETKLDKMTEIAQSDFDISPELTEDTLPMLYQTCYLTIKGYNREDHSCTLGYYTQTEVKSAVGRADAVCRTKDRTYVFEFKLDGSAEDALKQIDGKGYMIPYKKEGQCIKVGVNISSATRTLDSWKVSEE